MPPLARITGAGVGQVIAPSTVTVTDTATGYKAEVTPPTGKTAQELNGMLPGGAGDVLKTTLNSAYADMKITQATICVAASGAACAKADVVNVDITSDKSTTGKAAIPTTVAAMCTFRHER